MSRVNIDREPLDSLADAIAAKSERPVPLTIPGMRDAVLGIETGIEPAGTRNINKNGVYDVTEYALADVSVYPKLTSITIDPTTSTQFIEPDAGKDGFSSVQVNAASLQEKNVTPTEEYQEIYSETGYIGLSKVNISAIPGNYVGSLIPRNTADDLLVQGPRIYTAPGYYENQVSAIVAMVEAGTPTANKGAVSNNSVNITPRVTNTTGYIYGGTKTGTVITVTAAELVNGTKTITENGTGIDVVNYASVDVAVPAPSLQTKTATPTESTQSISADSGYDGLSNVTINPIPSNYGRITWDGSVLTVS